MPFGIETQVVLPRMQSDLVEVILSLLEGDTPKIVWDKEVMLGVVAASKGYPNQWETGAVLHGFTDLSPDVCLFHSGTAKNDEGQYVTSGGRVFLIAAKGKTIREAQGKVYSELAKVQCDGIFFREDIGHRAL